MMKPPSIIHLQAAGAYLHKWIKRDEKKKSYFGLMSFKKWSERKMTNGEHLLFKLAFYYSRCALEPFPSKKKKSAYEILDVSLDGQILKPAIA